MDQVEKAQEFKRLHVKGSPIVLYNAWDAGSAGAVAEAGAKAIATGSAPVAFAQGFADGQKMPIEHALANAERMVRAVELPVTLDFEGAYAVETEGVEANFKRALDTGVIGFNFEDQIIGGEGLHEIQVQFERIVAARNACNIKNVPAFINARTDLFLKARAKKEEPTQAMLDEAVERATAYAEAGGDGFFAPGLLDLEMIAELCDRISLPVNIIALPGAPENKALAGVGVARISYGPVPYKQMVHWLATQAKAAFDSLG